MNPITWVVGLTLAGLTASFSTAAIGIGGGLLVMPLLALFFSPRLAVVLSTPMFLANAVVTLYLYRRTAGSQRGLLVLPGVLVGNVLAIHWLQAESLSQLRWIIGGVALGFVTLEGYSLVTRKIVRGLPLWAGLPISVAAGMLSTLSNIGGTLVSVFLVDPDVLPAQFIGSMGLFYLTTSAAKIFLFLGAGLLSWREGIWALPSVPAIIIGAHWGRRFHQRLSPTVFAWILLSVIGLSAALLLIGA